MANKIARLGDLATYINGYAFKPADWGDTGLPIIRIQDLTGNSYQLNRYDGEYPERIEVNDGDVLISWSASLGVYVWQRGKALLNQHIFKVVFDKLPVNKEYFVFAVEHKLAEMESKTHGATMKHIVKKDFDGTTIPYPPIEKQAEIADHLRRITSLIDKQTEQLLLLDQLVKSRFIELFGDIVLNPFGWEKDYLGVVCDVRDGTHDSPHYQSTGFPLVTSKNVTGGEIDLTDCSLISEADFNKINERSKVNMGDIIMPMIGTVGKPVIVNVEPNFAIKNVSLIKFKDDSRVLNTFVRSLLQSDYFDDAVLSKVRGGTQKFISLGDIRKLAVIVPPIALQEQFAAFFEQTDKSKLAVQKGLQELEILKKSLMQQYFG